MTAVEGEPVSFANVLIVVPVTPALATVTTTVEVGVPADPLSTALPLASYLTRSLVVVVPVDIWTLVPLPCSPVAPVMPIAGVAPPEDVTGAVPVTLVTVPPPPAPPPPAPCIANEGVCRTTKAAHSAATNVQLRNLITFNSYGV